MSGRPFLRLRVALKRLTSPLNEIWQTGAPQSALIRSQFRCGMASNTLTCLKI